MRKLIGTLLPFALTAAAACASAQSTVRPAGPNLTVGDKAPSLEVAKWVKGTPVGNLDKGNIYVVEFWATWCGPCKISIPHLTELHKKFGSKATFIGVSSFENDWSGVEPFVESEGDQMDYDVAMDKIENPTDREGYMAKNWMEAAHQDGIPTAFIVDREGKIAWIGHPMNLEAPLAKVIAGTWDRAAAAKQFEAQMDGEKKQEEAAQSSPANKILRKCAADMASKNYRAAIADIDNLAQTGGPYATLADGLRLQVYASSGDSAHFSAAAQKLMAGKAKDDPMTLNQIAWFIVDPKSKLSPRNTKLALKAATHCVEVTGRKDAASLDTLAWCYYWLGKTSKAIEIEKEAMSKIGPGDNKSDYQMSMSTFKK